MDGEKAGTSQVAEPLTFVTVDDAGHMVRRLLGRLTSGDAHNTRYMLVSMACLVCCGYSVAGQHESMWALW